MTTILRREGLPEMWGRGNCSTRLHPEGTPCQIKAREHFLKYCDSHKCIRGSGFVVSAMNKGWHEGVYLECAFNPYNMVVPDDATDQPKAGA